MICPCGKDFSHVAVWPFNCGCGRRWGEGGEELRGPARPGLGDRVKAVLSRMGFEPCGGCRDRQRALNRLGERLGL